MRDADTAEPSEFARSSSLDLRGKGYPAVTTAAYQALKGLPAGMELVVMVDSLPALIFLPDLARDFNGSSVIEQLAEDVWRVAMRKGVT